jgi:phosphopantothenate---cysteine ligase (ATP)
MTTPTCASAQHEQENFLSVLTGKEIDELKLQLGRFVVAQKNLRPICLVSSGGTAADLEIHAVRCLDNFSTGLRGAVSIEELLKRGYAVIHLWRTGSASPYARVLSQYLGLKQSNYGLNVESLGRLFAILGEDTDDDLVQTVLEHDKDPWMTRTDQPTDESVERPGSAKSQHEIALHRGLVYSSAVQKALRERSEALGEGRLLTVSFRTVDEYLAKLQLCAQTLSISGSLAMFFLAAAVSDFYIPMSERIEHKIQSESNEDGLVLNLKPVPKVMGLLRQHWAPDAFVVSFKLETDKDILRQKAERAVERYGCHMVIGNLLQSRHDKVWILSPEDYRSKSPSSAKDWLMTEVAKARGSGVDSLESSIIDYVVQSHFEFISWHYNVDGSGAKAMQRTQEKLLEEKKQVRRTLFWNKAKSVGLEVTGVVLTLWISYTINSALQRHRQR